MSIDIDAIIYDLSDWHHGEFYIYIYIKLKQQSSQSFKWCKYINLSNGWDLLSKSKPIISSRGTQIPIEVHWGQRWWVLNL